MAAVGVRELKARLSEHLARVKAGEAITVTDRGRPIARLVPVEPPAIPPRLAELLASGQVRWNGQPLPPLRPLPVAPGDKTMAQLIAEGREGRL
jgi:prevent-host-death family protein